MGILSLVLIQLGSGELKAQLFESDYEPKYDSSYITVYKDELTTRAFLSRKQNGLNLNKQLLSPWIKYRTNDNLLLGVGYTYSFLTLNLSVKLPFINGDDELYGETKYLDLQANTYFRDLIIDFYLQWNKGYYMANPDQVFDNYRPNPAYPIRGDLRSNILGLNVQYLFNSERYSYKAAFLQNEFQKKSAGSPLLGVEAYWVLAMSDTAMIGVDVPPSGFLGDASFNQSDIINAGINGGYAYTLVWNETLYVGLSSVFGVSLGKNLIHNTWNSSTLYSRFTYGFTNSTRISLGYNNKSYYVGLSFIHFGMTNRVGPDPGWMGYNTGQIRISVVKRFITRRPIKILRPDLWIL